MESRARCQTENLDRIVSKNLHSAKRSQREKFNKHFPVFYTVDSFSNQKSDWLVKPSDVFYMFILCLSRICLFSMLFPRGQL